MALDGTWWNTELREFHDIEHLVTILRFFKQSPTESISSIVIQC